MGETAEKMIQFYERVNTGSIVSLAVSFLGAFFFHYTGEIMDNSKDIKK